MSVRSRETEFRFALKQAANREAVENRAVELWRKAEAERKRRRGHVAVKSLAFALSAVLSLCGLALGHKVSGGCPKAKPRVVMESVTISPGAIDGGASSGVHGEYAGSGLIHGS